MRMLLLNLTEKRSSKEGEKPCHVKEKALRKADVKEVSKMSEKWGVARGAKRIELVDDELMHWKYIKREKKPDGSYRYYYDTSSTASGRMREDIKKYASLRDSNNLKRIRSENLSNIYGLKAANHKNDTSQFLYDNYSAKEDLYRRKSITYKGARDSAETNRKKKIEEHTKYVSTRRGKIDTFIENTGMKMADILNKGSNKINNAKKWLDNLFKKK